MVGDAQRDQASPFIPQNDQNEQQPTVGRQDHEEVHGTDTGGIVHNVPSPQAQRRLAAPKARLPDAACLTSQPQGWQTTTDQQPLATPAGIDPNRWSASIGIRGADITRNAGPTSAEPALRLIREDSDPPSCL